jgi:hypothetical protein
MKIRITIDATITAPIYRLFVRGLTAERLRELLQGKAPAGVRVDQATIDVHDDPTAAPLRQPT